ncbi:hypothetical protein QYE76_042284 [Lolium multiflorum]|uniref:CCHC-type domain-containing protein n=1 Tax=Lolium multiflorum TaxID=4521 RepID=A0AAD8WWT6_LOLMU|nr:hypothetical protein QYE76_042284 [Lolium multiflorum]
MAKESPKWTNNTNPRHICQGADVDKDQERRNSHGAWKKEEEEGKKRRRKRKKRREEQAGQPRGRSDRATDRTGPEAGQTGQTGPNRDRKSARNSTTSTEGREDAMEARGRKADVTEAWKRRRKRSWTLQAGTSAPDGRNFRPTGTSAPKDRNFRPDAAKMPSSAQRNGSGRNFRPEGPELPPTRNFRPSSAQLPLSFRNINNDDGTPRIQAVHLTPSTIASSTSSATIIKCFPSTIYTPIMETNMDSEDEPTEDDMEYDEGDSSASTADMEDHVELDTDNGSASIGDMTDIEHLYTDHDSPSMDNMVDHHSELDHNIDDMVEHYLDYDYDTMMEHRTEHHLDYDIDTMVEPSFDTTLHKNGAYKFPILANGTTYDGMLRIVIDTRHLKIVVDHHHLMIAIDMRHHMIIADTSHLIFAIDIRHHMIIADTSHLMFAINQHLPRIFDDTPQDMVMMQEDESLDMKRPRLQRKMVASAHKEEPPIMVPSPPTATTTMAPTRSSSPKMKTMESTLQDEGRSTHLYANMTMICPPRPRSSQCFRCTQDGHHLWECPNLHCDVCTSNKHMTWECNTPQAHKLYFAQLDAQFANKTLQDTIIFKEWCKEMDKMTTMKPTLQDGVEKVEHGMIPSTKVANGVENGEHGMIPSPMEAHGDDKIEPTPICLNDELVPTPCEHESHLAHLSESDSELSDFHPICEFECFHLEDMSDTQSELREVDDRSMEDIAFANTLTSPSFVSSYVAIGSMEDEFPIMEKMYMVHEDDDITPCLQEVKDVDHMDPTTSTTPTSNESDYKGNNIGVDDAMIPLVDMMTYECMHDLEDTIAMPHASFIPPCDALLDNIVDHVGTRTTTSTATEHELTTRAIESYPTKDNLHHQTRGIQTKGYEPQKKDSTADPKMDQEEGEEELKDAPARPGTAGLRTPALPACSPRHCRPPDTGTAGPSS